MKQVKLIIKFSVLILTIFLLIYFISKIYEKYFDERQIINLEENLTNEKSELKNLKDRPPLNTEIDLPEKNNTNQISEIVKEDETDRTSEFEISLDDCKNECENYINELEKQTYCKQVCGLVPIKKNGVTNETTNSELEKNDDCTDLSGLKKDYCWRDQAINETDFEKCQKIEDKNIFKQCQNRLAEDIVDSQF